MYSKIDLLSAATGPEQERLLQLLEEFWLEGGEEIHPLHKETAYCFIVIDGWMSMQDPLMGRWLIPPGGAFGLAELLSGSAHKRTYRAACRCTLLGLSYPVLIELVKGQDALAQKIQIELSRLAGQYAQHRLARLSQHLGQRK